MIQHVGDDVALYALGALDETSVAVVEQHASGCTACAAALDRACDDVAAMVASARAPAVPATEIPRARPPARTWVWPAVAAAIAFALLPASMLYRQDAALREQVAQENEMMSRLLSPDARTAAFSRMPGGHSARVIYGPTGAWYVVMIKGTQRPLQVAWMHDGRETMLGTTRNVDTVAMLYLPRSHRMGKLALMDGGAVVGEADLAF